MQARFWLTSGQSSVRFLNAPARFALMAMLIVSLPVPAVDAGPLDGRQYSAGIVRNDADDGDRKRPLEDRLTFRDGKFSSAVCKRFNFGEAPYWVREENGRIHFLAELTSPTDGTMVWKGTVRGDTLEGTMRWIKKRWYWTIDTAHRIRGKLDNQPIPLRTPTK